MALSPCRTGSVVVDAEEGRRYHSVGPWPRTNHQTVTGGRGLPGLAAVVTAAVPPEQASAWLGRWMGRLRRPWGSASCPERCSVCTPKAKAIAGEPIRTSRIYPGESQFIRSQVRVRDFATVEDLERILVEYVGDLSIIDVSYRIHVPT